MTDIEKKNRIKILLGCDAIDDNLIIEMLKMAGGEILSWRYGGKKPSEVPAEYENVQIQAVITGFTLMGAEGQTAHEENGINRTFAYPDMAEYIHRNVIPYVKVI